MEENPSGLLELTAPSVQSLFPRVNDDVYLEVHKFAICEVLHVLLATSPTCGEPLSSAVHTSRELKLKRKRCICGPLFVDSDGQSGVS
jgi:hypothetical protein